MACERKLVNCSFIQEEEDEEQDEDALSLSDLPINLIKEDNNKSYADEESRHLIKSEDDFYFGSLSIESEMCAADDVFFRGQILPQRHSISSESDLTKFKPLNLNAINCLSGSKSMDHFGSFGGFTGFSSKSSSIKSHYSSSSTCSSTTTTTTARNPKPRIRNQFHTHPSPNPQIRVSTTPTIRNRSRKSTIWEFFRPGLVPIPGIELQDLKVRCSVSRNRSSESNNNSINRREKIQSSTGHCEQSTNMEKQKKQRKHLLLSGCSCSVGTVKPVQQKIVVLKGNFDDNNHNIKGSTRTSKEGWEKPLQELKMKNKK